jgi:hypothetical protein
MPQLKAGGIVHLGSLLRDCVDDFLPPMPGIDAPQPRGAIQDLAIIG